MQEHKLLPYRVAMGRPDRTALSSLRSALGCGTVRAVETRGISDSEEGK